MRVLLFGATGTIADSVFKIVKNNQSKLKVVAATCNTNYKKLEKLKINYGIKKIGINNYKSAKKYISLCGNRKNKSLFIGIENFSKLITKDIKLYSSKNSIAYT